MSTSFIELTLATLTGVGAFYLLEAVYYAIIEKVKQRQIQNWWDELEEEHWEAV
jgi:hypothetical protein